MEFTVVQGDITEQRADALVNAANTDIQMGGGVAGALRNAAGEAIQREADRKSPIGLGEAVETDAYDLDAEYVVHAATMELGGEASEASIRNATRTALSRADDLGCTSIVLPALGCGIAGIDLDDGAHYIFEEILDYEPTTLTEVEVIGYGEDSYETMARIAQETRAKDG
jgi:O-acetyl-ADP-ribose deacetylase (regulator of RNase III)